MVEDASVWTPELLEHLLDGTWVGRGQFRAQRVVASRKNKVPKALFVAYSDDTFRKYMGGCNYVYFARPGRRFGNSRAAEAAAKEGWVSALIVEQELPVTTPQLIVPDAFAALEVLASYRRSLIDSPVVAVTGTVGKSSTIKALEAVFGKHARRLSRKSNTRKPLALGMANAPVDQPGLTFLAEVSISALWGEDGGAGQFLRPDVALMTEIGLGMTHRVPTVQDTAAEKMNLVDHMPPDGTLLYNTDMNFASYVKDRGLNTPVQTLGYGFGSEAQYRVDSTYIDQRGDGRLGQSIVLQMPKGQLQLKISAMGKAHSYAAVAAVAVADQLGVDHRKAAERATNYVPSKTSEQIYSVLDEKLGVSHTIVDGTFSATPLSMRNSFHLASEIHELRHGRDGDFVAVLARIVALGGAAEAAHAELAEPLIRAGVDRVYTYGPDLAELVQLLSARGLHAGHYESTGDLVSELTGNLRVGSTVLLKGSKRASNFRNVRDELNTYFTKDKVIRHVTVSGKVQSSEYKRWVKSKADEAGLVGWVRNSSLDVEVFIQGTRKAVDDLILSMKADESRVTVAEVVSEEVTSSSTQSFEIRPSGSDESRVASAGPYQSSRWPQRYTADVVSQAFGSQKLSSFCIALEAWRRGLNVTFSSADGIRFTVEDGQNRIAFNGSRSSLTTRQAIRVVDDKNETLERLQAAGLPTPKSRMFDAAHTDLDSVVSVAKRDYRWPVVVKPVSGSRGDGVFAKITTPDELKRSLEYIVDDLGKSRVLLEEHASGDDCRVYVVGDTIAAACRRIPANVVGDGKLSINELVAQKNAARMKNPFLSKGLIKPDVEIENMLGLQSLAFDSVPENGQQIQLRQKANASAGGDVADVTDTLPISVRRAAVKAVASVPGLAAAGVDVLLDSDVESEDSDGFVIIELNARAHIGVNMYPTIGSGVDVPSVVIDKFFPGTVGRTSARADNAIFDLDTVLEPLRLGSASKVQVSEIPKGHYPKRVAYDFNEVIKLSDRQQRRLRLASRVTGAASSLVIEKTHSLLIVGGRHDQVDAFMDRATRIMNKEFPHPSEWNGIIVQGFHVRSQVSNDFVKSAPR